MRVELPVYRRCCFCLPLRNGLITWGYIRIMASALLFIGLFFLFYGMLGMALYHPDVSYTIGTVIFGLLLTLLLTDMAFNIVFVIGNHKKRLNLLRIYYVYSIIFWVLSTMIAIGASIYFIILITEEKTYTYKIWVALLDVVILIAQLLIQAYILLLVRSEIIKLRSNCQFRFVNTSESERIRCGEQIASAEDENEDVHGRTYVPKDSYQFIGRRNDDDY